MSIKEIWQKITLPWKMLTYPTVIKGVRFEDGVVYAEGRGVFINIVTKKSKDYDKPLLVIGENK